MEAKYGSKWAKAIVAVGIVTLPLPGSTAGVIAMCGLAHLSNKLFAARSTDDIDWDEARRLSRRELEAWIAELEDEDLEPEDEEALKRLLR